MEGNNNKQGRCIQDLEDDDASSLESEFTVTDDDSSLESRSTGPDIIFPIYFTPSPLEGEGNMERLVEREQQRRQAFRGEDGAQRLYRLSPTTIRLDIMSERDVIPHRNPRQNTVFLDEDVDPFQEESPGEIPEDDCSIDEQPKANISKPNEPENADRCSICLQPEEDVPVRMPCNHMFCLTCAKGLYRFTGRCSLCRAKIPDEFKEYPERFVVEPLQEPIAGLLWFYRSRSGWWAYTPRMQRDLENAFQSKKSTLECFLNGLSCVVDFTKSKQQFGPIPARCQNIKRDTSGSFSHLGVAGLKYQDCPASGGQAAIPFKFPLAK